MNQEQWRAIEAAAELLGLAQQASITEIKRAYHRLSKRYHPDSIQRNKDANHEQMYALTAAYDLLMRYSESYPFPLRQELQTDRDDLYDPEEWWRARFGQDPLWSGSKKRQR